MHDEQRGDTDDLHINTLNVVMQRALDRADVM